MIRAAIRELNTGFWLVPSAVKRVSVPRSNSPAQISAPKLVVPVPSVIEANHRPQVERNVIRWALYEAGISTGIELGPEADNEDDRTKDLILWYLKKTYQPVHRRGPGERPGRRAGSPPLIAVPQGAALLPGRGALYFRRQTRDDTLCLP